MTTAELIQSINPRNIWEIGVGLPELSYSIGFVNLGIPIKMFEPNPSNYAKLCARYNGLPNVDIYNIALYNREGLIEMSDANECSSILEICGPNAEEQRKSANKFLIPAVKVSRFDYGQIDILLIDVEGAEWNVLQDMVSVPRVIHMELVLDNTFKGGKRWENPDWGFIRKWLNDRRYIAFGNDGNNYTFIQKNLNR